MQGKWKLIFLVKIIFTKYANTLWCWASAYFKISRPEVWVLKKKSGLFCWIPWLLCIWPVLCFWCIILISVSPKMISAFKKPTFLKQKSLRLHKKSLIMDMGWWLAQFCTTYWAWSLWFALLHHYDYDTVSIISFIRNSLGPISEHLYFCCLQEYYLKYLFSELAKYGKKRHFPKFP